jgi:sterol desaturase/sphingolipid hydroxylase (fatty acid hydroxylase superfamily)
VAVESVLEHEIVRERSRASERMRATWLKSVGDMLPGRYNLFAVLPVDIPDWSQPQPGRLRIFKSDLLESLTVVHPIIPLAIYVPFSGWLLWKGALAGYGSVALSAMFTGGLFFWTFFEYIMHRGVFHFTPKNGWQIVLGYFTHGIHHAYPDDDRRLVMPPILSLTFSIPVVAMFVAAMGWKASLPTMSGFYIGYLCYDMTHYAVHAMTMRSRFGNYLRKHHMLHHYATPDRRYGVSTPLWDVVFGTYS